MAGQPARRLFSVDEYYRMGETGVLTRGDRVELIEGEVFRMTPIGTMHASCVDRLNALFHRLLAERTIVRVQSPVRLDNYSEPEPDIAVLRPRQDYYAASHPAPGDVLLIVEVSDATLEYDREVKVPLYARAEIPEVWIVDTAGKCVESYAQSTGGSYCLHSVFRQGDSIASLGVPELKLNVDLFLD